MSHLPAPLPPPSGENGRRVEALRAAMRERILVLDGAMGTLIQAQNLKAGDFGGAEYEGCNEHLVITRPEVIERIHADYFAAGADVTETDTFGGTPLVLGEFGLAHKALEINAAASQVARKAAAAAEAKDGRMRWVAGSIGPTTKAISVTGGITFEELVDNFAVQAEGLTLGGSDYLLVETCQDTRNVKAALLGIQRAFRKLGWALPVAVSGTIEPMGTMLAGQSVESLAASLEHSGAALPGPQLRHGPRVHDGPHPLAGGHVSLPGVLRAQRGPAGRERALPGDAGDAGPLAAALL